MSLRTMEARQRADGGRNGAGALALHWEQDSQQPQLLAVGTCDGEI
jgi:hypothetical protein